MTHTELWPQRLVLRLCNLDCIFVFDNAQSMHPSAFLVKPEHPPSSQALACSIGAAGQSVILLPKHRTLTQGPEREDANLTGKHS